MSDAIKRWPCDHKLSDMVAHGGLLYLSGQVAENLAANTKGQTAEVLGMIDRLLTNAGSHKSKLLSASIFIPEMRDKPQIDEAWLAWADPQSLPARAVMEARLGSVDTRVEIICVATQ